MSMFRKQLKDNSTVSKQFDYSKGDVSLKFSLRIDIKDQLKDFKELLKKALEDVEIEINKEPEVHRGSGFGYGGGAGGAGQLERKQSK